MEQDNSYTENKQNSWAIGLYYLILLIIALSWTNRDLVEPNRILRYIFLISFIIPFIKYPNLAPAMITLFLSIRVFSVSPFGYLPTKIDLYFKLALILYLFHLFYGLKGSKTNIALIIFLTIATFSNLVNRVTEPYGPYEYNFIRFLLITVFLSKLFKSRDDIRLMEWSFIIISFCLSIYGLIFYKDFTLNAIGPQDSERIYWSDPNYLGCVIAIGIVISFYNLITVSHQVQIFKIFFLATIILGLVNLGMFASRGAFLTVSLPILYILYKKTNSFKNVLFTLIILGIFVMGFMTLSIFQPLLSRFSDETILTGSGRLEMWKGSIESFFNSDLMTLIFGGGGTFAYQITGKSIGSMSITSPHNNYLEILYDYGITGLIVFISLLVYWFKTNIKNVLVISLLLILAVSSLTLSPLMYPPFWFLIILIENQNRNFS